MKLGKLQPINRTKLSMHTKAKAIKQRSLMTQLIGNATINKIKSNWGDEDMACQVDDGSDNDDYLGTGDILMAQKLDVALKFPYDAIHKFHIGVWRECCKHATEALLMVTLNNRRDYHDKFQDEFVIAFQNEEHKAESVAWWAEYQARFNNMSETKLPEFVTGQTINGFAISTKNEVDRHTRDDWELFPEWVWIVKNTTGKVYYTKEFWFFEDSSELVQFKLVGVIPRDKYNF